MPLGVNDFMRDCLGQPPEHQLCGATPRVVSQCTPIQLSRKKIHGSLARHEEIAAALGGDEGEPATAEQLAALEFEPFSTETTDAVYRDFSADRWTDECLDHGIALRLAYAVLTKTKEESRRGRGTDGAGVSASSTQRKC